MKKYLILAACFTAFAIYAFVSIAGPGDITQAAALFLQHHADMGLAMATLAVAKTRDYQLGDNEEYPVIAADIIYQGAAVGENGSGYSRPLVAGDPFQGFAIATADNSLGAAGAINVNVRAKGRLVLPIAALAITANDRPAVYASDDDTFTLTVGSNSLIGYVSRWVSTGFAVVEFDAALAKAALQA